MGINWPLHSAQPFGAKPKLKILISDRNGSATLPPIGPAALRSRVAVAKAAGRRDEQHSIHAAVADSVRGSRVETGAVPDVLLDARRGGRGHSLDTEVVHCRR